MTPVPAEPQPSARLAVCPSCGSDSTSQVRDVGGRCVLRCRECRLVRFDSVFPPGRIYRDGYHTGEIEFGWDWASDREYELANAQARLRWLERFQPPGRLLDVGGGLGYLTMVASQRGWEAELLEPVAQAVQYARTELNVQARHGGTEQLEAIQDRYDVVCFIHSLEHLTAPIDALRSAAARLEVGGRILVEVPNYGSACRRWQGLEWMGWQPGEHVGLFERDTLISLVRKAGLEVRAVRTVVPVWDGLVPDGYAHLLGLQSLLRQGLRMKRALASGHPRRRDKGSPRAGTVISERTRTPVISPDPLWRAPIPVREESGLRRLLYKDAFSLVARIEQRLNLGTNLQLLAAPAERL